jgi:hypothetical protein
MGKMKDVYTDMQDYEVSKLVVSQACARSVLQQMLLLRDAALSGDLLTAIEVGKWARQRNDASDGDAAALYAEAASYAYDVITTMESGGLINGKRDLDDLADICPEVAVQSWQTVGADREQAQVMVYLNGGQGNW